MKKIISIILCILLLCGISANATGLEIDGVMVDSDIIFQDNTAYVPLSSVAQAMGVRYSFDAKTQSAFINGIKLFPTSDGKLSIYVNGKKYTPSDSSANIIVQDDAVYLPAHLVAEAVGMTAKWYPDTPALVFSKEVQELSTFVPDEGKTYAIINLDTKEALTAGDNSLSAELYGKKSSQEFKFIKTEYDGYYHIQSTLTGKNIDVYNHGTTPGVSIITWDPGAGDNQKFTLENTYGGTYISARSCHLPIEAHDATVRQNVKTSSDNQKWVIIPFGSYYKTYSTKAEKLVIRNAPTVKDVEEEDAPYRTFSIDNMYLTEESDDLDGFKALPKDNATSLKWVLTEHSEDVYLINNAVSQKSIDVYNHGTTPGVAIITWQTTKSPNQRWILEQNGDGTYYIKSVLSSLYLTLTDDGKLVQESKNNNLKQRWTVSDAY